MLGTLKTPLESPQARSWKNWRHEHQHSIAATLQKLNEQRDAAALDHSLEQAFQAGLAAGVLLGKQEQLQADISKLRRHAQSA